MRIAPGLTTDEILEAEKAKEARKNFRKGGLNGMKLRDQGSAKLSNGAMIMWPVQKPEFSDIGGPYVYPRAIQEGTFVLKIDGKEHVFDTEEFQRWLRWA